MTLKLSTYDQLLNGQIYRGDIDEDDGIRFSREIRFWPQGGRSGSLATGTISIDNRDGTYDYLLRTDVRDQDIIEFERDGETLLTGIIDNVTAPDDRTIRFQLRDILTRLDRPLQIGTFGDEADEAVSNTVLPITIGLCRNIRPVLYDAVDASFGPAYRANDFGLTGATNVRDRGIELDPNTSPAQWTFDQRIGNAGLIIDVEPAGILTCDVSTAGIGGYSTTDELSGDGLFETSFTGAVGFRSTTADPLDPADLPSGWGRIRTPSSDGVPGDPYEVTYDDGLRLLNAASDTAFNRLFTADGSGNVTTAFLSGKTYRLQFTIEKLAGGGPVARSGSFHIRMSGSLRSVFELRADRGEILGNSFVADFTVTEGTDQGLALSLEGNGPELIISGLEAFEADTPAVDSVDGITLPNYMQEVVFRTVESLDNLTIADLEAIDSTSIIGFYASQPVTALSVIRKALDSFAADIYSDRQGKIRFAQLRDPALDLATFRIDAERLLSPPSISVDPASGLTTQATARKNWYRFRDADFADNLTAIPLQTRQAYTQQGQLTLQASLPEGFPRLYQHAIEAEPLDSLCDSGTVVQNEIQRVVDLYNEPRLFVDVEIGLDPDEFIELNDVVLLEYNRYGFDNGVNFLVVGVEDVITGKEGRRRARLTLWGSSGRNFAEQYPAAPPFADGVFLLTESGVTITTETEEPIEV
jgi:hypothetical protein